jgi:hypothetical protein
VGGVHRDHRSLSPTKSCGKCRWIPSWFYRKEDGGRAAIGPDDHPVDSRPERYQHPLVRQELLAGLAPVCEAGTINRRWRSAAMSGSSRGAFGTSPGRLAALHDCFHVVEDEIHGLVAPRENGVVDESIAPSGDGGFEMHDDSARNEP